MRMRTNFIVLGIVGVLLNVESRPNIQRNLSKSLVQFDYLPDLPEHFVSSTPMPAIESRTKPPLENFDTNVLYKDIAEYLIVDKEQEGKLLLRYRFKQNKPSGA